MGCYKLSKGWRNELHSNWEMTVKRSFSLVNNKEVEMKDGMQEMARVCLCEAEKIIKRKQSLKMIL